jgi:hypothetical protein
VTYTYRENCIGSYRNKILGCKLNVTGKEIRSNGGVYAYANGYQCFGQELTCHLYDQKVNNI